MPVTRSFVWLVPFALSALLWNTLDRGTVTAAPNPAPPEPAQVAAGYDFEVKCVDDSLLRLRLNEEKLELVTKYGFLQIALGDIRRIEFATRCPADVAEKIALAISRLGHPDFQVRERAVAELKAYRVRAYQAALKATKSDDPEVSRRAEEVVKYLQSRMTPVQLEPRESDVVYTDDSKFTGKLTAESVRVYSAQFGDQKLRLADARSLRSGSGGAADADDLQNAPAAPASLMVYQQQHGKELSFKLTGYTVGAGQQPGMWGTDIYTLDSNLAAAAVHAGIAKPGESVVVRIRIVQSPPQFVSSFRNGLTSTAYGNYPAGAFEFVRK